MVEMTSNIPFNFSDLKKSIKNFNRDIKNIAMKYFEYGVKVPTNIHII